MPSYSQENRPLSLAAPLGDDVLLLTGFSGREELSQLFSFQLEMFSPEEDIDPTALVGKAVTWAVSWHGSRRYFNGVVRRFSAGPHDPHGVRLYRAEVVPWLWFLTRTTNCRIFQHKSVPEIVQAIFGDLKFSDYQFVLRGSYPKREYCVQYRETALNFVSRLLEQEGIFYFFRHEEGKHTLVLADNNTVFPPATPLRVATWEHSYTFCSGQWTHTDYDFENPSTNLLSSSQTVVPLSAARKFELFDYPGLYVKKSPVGEGYAKVRMEAEELGYDGASGTGENESFSAGVKFTLTEYDIASERGKEYVLTSVQHFAEDPTYFDSSKAASYRNEFLCIPAKVNYRPPQRARKPFVQGPQTAVVVGPLGEELYCDKYGRVKVQFHWDREGKKDQNSSCWIRVAQIWAGKGWGAFFWPRIGHEVVVVFEEGDPDRPLIIGSVYNGQNMPPVTLPAERTLGGIKSCIFSGNPGSHFNAIIFHDTPGLEFVQVHSEKLEMSNSERNRYHYVHQAQFNFHGNF